MGGRGDGKTRARTEWVRSQVEGVRPGDCGPARCVALVGETLDQAREVIVFGDSGVFGLLTTRQTAEVACQSETADLAQRRSGADFFGARSRKPAWPTV